jgi:hypothetical protein
MPAQDDGATPSVGRRPKTFTEADIVRADFPLSARPASRPSRTAGLLPLRRFFIFEAVVRDSVGISDGVKNAKSLIH